MRTLLATACALSVLTVATALAPPAADAATSLTKAELVGHFPAGDQPTTIALIRGGTQLAVANRGDSTVDVFDAETMERLQHYPVTSVGHGVWDVAELPGRDELVAANWVGEHVTIFDGKTGAVRDLVKTGIKPSYVAVSPDGKMAYAPGLLTNDVTIVDLETRKPRRSLEVGQKPMGLALSPDGRWLYVAACGSNKVCKVDLKYEVVLSNFGAPLAETTNLVVTPDGRHVLAAGDHGNLLVIDSDEGQTRKIDVGGDLAAVELSPDGATAYVTVYDRNEVAVVDLITGTVVDRLATGPGPIDLAVRDDRLWIVNDQAEAITVYRLSPIRAMELPPHVQPSPSGQ